MNMKKGFTLVEIMVVISIIALVSIFALPGFISSRNRTMVDNAATALAADLDEWRNKAVSGWTVLNLDTMKGGVDSADIVDGATADQTVLPKGLVYDVAVLGGREVFADLSSERTHDVELGDFLTEFKDMDVVDIWTDLGQKDKIEIYYATPTGEISLYDMDGNSLEYAKISVSVWDLGLSEVAAHRDMDLVEDVVVEGQRSNIYVCEKDSESVICTNN